MQSPPDPQWNLASEDADRPRMTFTHHERALVSQAAADLAAARATDLTRLDTVGLILMVERLRSTLDDVVHLLCSLQS